MHPMTGRRARAMGRSPPGGAMVRRFRGTPKSPIRLCAVMALVVMTWRAAG